MCTAGQRVLLIDHSRYLTPINSTSFYSRSFIHDSSSLLSEWIHALLQCLFFYSILFHQSLIPTRRLHTRPDLQSPHLQSLPTLRSLALPHLHVSPRGTRPSHFQFTNSGYLVKAKQFIHRGSFVRQSSFMGHL